MERWREEGREGSGDDRRSPLMVDRTISYLQRGVKESREVVK